MASVTRVIAGIAGAGLTCVGGYYVCSAVLPRSSGKKEEVEGPKETTPPSQTKAPIVPQTLSAAANSTYQSNSLAKSYDRYLLDPKQNKEIWEQRFQEVIKTPSPVAGAIFNSASVLSAWSDSSTTNTALNNTCHTYYQKEIKGTEEDGSGMLDTSSSEWQDLWFLCAKDPVTFLHKENPAHEDGTIGKAKEHELLSTTANDSLWSEKTNDFFALTTPPTEQKFKELYEAEKDKEAKSNLKDKCKELYSLKSSDEGVPTADVVAKYCSMKPIVGE